MKNETDCKDLIEKDFHINWLIWVQDCISTYHNNSQSHNYINSENFNDMFCASILFLLRLSDKIGRVAHLIFNFGFFRISGDEK